MRFHFILALVLTLTIGSTYWYESTKHICPIPIGYRLGVIDSSFSITREEASEAIAQAVAVWEDSVGRELFVQDDQADLAVSFVFDDRQALADAQVNDQARLDEVSRQNDAIRDTIADLQVTYETMQEAFETRRAAYDASLETYDTAVRQANDRGGATPAEFADLEETRVNLQTESQTLRASANELSNVAAQLNDLSAEGNRIVRAYNVQVEAFNAEYGTGDQFTQGDFTGDAIHIYKFSNQTELVTVLAHEFGHALGVGHVEGSGSLMYFLLEDDDTVLPTLSQTDKEAYNNTCQIDSWDFKLRSIIRSIIS